VRMRPGLYSMLRTSVVPTMLKAGVGLNVIPSEAEATLDIRAVPGENLDDFFTQMGRVINDPAVKIVPLPRMRPPSPAARLDNEMYRVMNDAAQTIYPGAVVLLRCPPARATIPSSGPRAFNHMASAPPQLRMMHFTILRTETSSVWPNPPFIPLSNTFGTLW